MRQGVNSHRGSLSVVRSGATAIRERGGEGREREERFAV